MPELDLKSDDGLRRACEEAEARMDEAPHAERLRARVDLLRRVRETPPQQRASEEFLRFVSFDTTLGTNLPPDSHVGSRCDLSSSVPSVTPPGADEER